MAEQSLGQVIDFDARKGPDGAFIRIPRPPALSVKVSDQEWVEAIRDYVLGEKLEKLVDRLRVKTVGHAREMARTAAWRRIEYMLREDLKYTVFGRVQRMECAVLDLLEDRIENGDYAYDMFGKEHRQKLNVVKLLEVHKRLTGTKEAIEKTKHSLVNKEDEALDPQRIFAALARAVTREQEHEKVKTIPGEVVREDSAG